VRTFGNCQALGKPKAPKLTKIHDCVIESQEKPMTAQKLLGTLKFLDRLDSQLGLQTNLDSIKDYLNNLVSAPANPGHQSALANAIAGFTGAASKLRESISPSQMSLISEMGGGDFFDPDIAERVKASISTNAMTPSVARDFVTDLASRRSAFLSNVRDTIRGLERLNIGDAGPEPGSADLAFLIPRDLFKNHLGAFAKELSFISNLIQHVSEGVTGKAVPVELEELSSSVPTIALGAGLATVVSLATIVNKFLEAWERIRKIRSLRSELTEIGMKGAAVEELSEQITTTVKEVVEESTEIVLVHYQGDVGRKNELANALKQETHRLFGQIERGLTIEFRAEPKPDAGEEDKQALETVSNLNRLLQFPRVANEPMLLESGQVLEGEIHAVKQSKASKTTTTSTSKKEQRKEVKPETKES
jgi:hypothetical protein